MNVSYRWMAPELLTDSSARATFATDVYSVTMTSLEIFTASDPFEGDSDALVLSQVVQNQRPDKPDDVEDELWSLWGEGWNQDAAKHPDMESYVERLAQLIPCGTQGVGLENSIFKALGRWKNKSNSCVGW
ncbi:hypothetical protein BYT27DRAFT_7240850 [Phlegmacium glaucopus]|nr:hypothetical protein BYT27DRAFT_7240850 [Phlegmacium glaucopus]